MHITAPLRQGVIPFLRSILATHQNKCWRSFAGNQEQLRPDQKLTKPTPPSQNDEKIMALGVVRMIRKHKLMSNYQHYLGHKDWNYEVIQIRSQLHRCTRSRILNHQIWNTVAGILEINGTEGTSGDGVGPPLKWISDHLFCDYSSLCETMVEFVEGHGRFNDSISDYIHNCKWASLAEQLYFDNREIHFLMTKTHAKPFIEIIKDLRRTYFEDSPAEDPKAWIPKLWLLDSTDRVYNAERESFQKLEAVREKFQERVENGESTTII